MVLGIGGIERGFPQGRRWRTRRSREQLRPAETAWLFVSRYRYGGSPTAQTIEATFVSSRHHQRSIHGIHEIETIPHPFPTVHDRQSTHNIINYRRRGISSGLYDAEEKRRETVAVSLASRQWTHAWTWNARGFFSIVTCRVTAVTRPRDTYKA